MPTILLLIASNIFMTIAWYWHLYGGPQAAAARPVITVIAISWALALVEYSFAVPANRIGYGRFTLPQLKVMQEVITLLVFGVFAAGYMRERLTLNHFWAACCLVGAIFFTFRK